MKAATEKLAETAMPVERVVRAVLHALCARRPKTRYPVDWRTGLSIFAFRRLPEWVRDWIIRRELGLP